MTKVNGVLFDLDGTLLDSITLIVSAKKHVAKVHRLREPSQDEIIELIQQGKSVQGVIGALWPDIDITKLIVTNTEFAHHNGHLARGYEGLQESLQSLSNKKIVMAAVTGATSKVINALKNLGIDQHFTAIIHSERVVKHKPDPEGMLLAMSECNLDAANTVLVGDTMYDIQAGKAANLLATVGITHGFGTQASLEHAGADYIVSSLSEVVQIIDKIENNES